ncbi:hypothetical protein V9T40_009096 [Parthenolecanium corni]|uniref:Uncharacterized protein n=1 Tax=Parthenolecanium corni TaxID=536013 RepID=A0AAN9Y8Q7_9HEMI
MDVDDSEDQVVKEIPVHLCKDLFEKLYLFQFPCRPSDANSNTKNIIASRVKPKSGLFELDCALKIDDKFYDKLTGEKYGTSKQNTKDPFKQNPLLSIPVNEKPLDRITLQSQRSILQKDIASYSVASLSEGKLCISPLHDSFSFLPNYQHIEQNKKLKGGPKISSANDSSDSSEDEDMDNTPAVQVTVKFSPRNLDKSKISQEMSHQQYLMKTAEEPWCETTYHCSNSSLALTKLEALTKTSSDKVTSLLSLTEREYLDILIPPETDELSQEN